MQRYVGEDDVQRENERGATPTPWQIDSIVERAIQRGEVSPREARALRNDVADLMMLDRRARRAGTGSGQRREIERRSNDLLARLSEDGRRYGCSQVEPRRDDGHPAQPDRNPN